MITHALVGPNSHSLFTFSTSAKLPTWWAGGDLNAQLRTTKPHMKDENTQFNFLCNATFHCNLQPRVYLEGEIKILLFRFIRKFQWVQMNPYLKG